MVYIHRHSKKGIFNVRTIFGITKKSLGFLDGYNSESYNPNDGILTAALP